MGSELDPEVEMPEYKMTLTDDQHNKGFADLVNSLNYRTCPPMRVVDNPACGSLSVGCEKEFGERWRVSVCVCWPVSYT